MLIRGSDFSYESRQIIGLAADWFHHDASFFLTIDFMIWRAPLALPGINVARFRGDVIMLDTSGIVEKTRAGCPRHDWVIAI